MSREVDPLLDDLWAWAEGLRRGAVTDGLAVAGGSSITDEVTRRVVVGLVGPIAEGVERAANTGDRTLPAAVRDLFGLP